MTASGVSGTVPGGVIPPSTSAVSRSPLQLPRSAEAPPGSGVFEKAAAESSDFIVVASGSRCVRSAVS